MFADHTDTTKCSPHFGHSSMQYTARLLRRFDKTHKAMKKLSRRIRPVPNTACDIWTTSSYPIPPIVEENAVVQHQDFYTIQQVNCKILDTLIHSRILITMSLSGPDIQHMPWLLLLLVLAFLCWCWCPWSWYCFFRLTSKKTSNLPIIDLIDGLVQDSSNSIANALGLLQSGAKPSISSFLPDRRYCYKSKTIVVHMSEIKMNWYVH